MQISMNSPQEAQRTVLDLHFFHCHLVILDHFGWSVQRGIFYGILVMILCIRL